MKASKTYKQHWIGKAFDPLSGQPYDDLRESIREQGQLNPIWIYEGRVLDGWNRYRACLDLGRTPDTKPYTGDDPIGFVRAQNVERRNLDATQLAKVAHRLSKGSERGRPRKRGTGASFSDLAQTVKDAAERIGASARTVKQVRRIDETIPAVMEHLGGARGVSAKDADTVAGKVAKLPESDRPAARKRVAKALKKTLESRASGGDRHATLSANYERLSLSPAPPERGTPVSYPCRDIHRALADFQRFARTLRRVDTAAADVPEDAVRLADMTGRLMHRDSLFADLLDLSQRLSGWKLSLPSADGAGEATDDQDRFERECLEEPEEPEFPESLAERALLDPRYATSYSQEPESPESLAERAADWIAGLSAPARLWEFADGAFARLADDGIWTDRDKATLPSVLAALRERADRFAFRSIQEPGSQRSAIFCYVGTLDQYSPDDLAALDYEPYEGIQPNVSEEWFADRLREVGLLRPPLQLDALFPDDGSDDWETA